jgi:hypothetical protein
MRRPAALALLLCLILLAGCSQLSVRHMKRMPWVVNSPQALEMKYWRFHFESMPLPGKFGVRGTAYPLSRNLPEWAERIDTLWLAAYLSDSQGRVLAKDLQVYLPRPLDPVNGVPFEFILEPHDLGRAGQLYLTFGYRMELTPEPGDEAAQGPDATAGEEGRDGFFAFEGPLTPF